MANITRYDPFEDTFPEVFKGFFKPIRMAGESAIDIRMDVKENDKAYTVRADIPGAKKEDINVSIDGNMVSISAEVKREKEEKDEKTLRSERYYGAVSRSFSLDSDVDEKAAIAKYNDGVLELVLPKKGNGQAKRLAVQ